MSRPLVRSAPVVGLKTKVKVLLDLRDGVVPDGPPLDAKMFLEEPAVETRNQAVGRGPPHVGGSVFDVLELREELVGMLVRPTVLLASVVAQDRSVRRSYFVGQSEGDVKVDSDGLQSPR